MMINNGELVEMWGVDVGDFVGMFSQSFVLLSVVCLLYFVDRIGLKLNTIGLIPI